MKRFLIYSFLVFLLALFSFFILVFNYYSGGNEYARYENISVFAVEIDQVNKLTSQVDGIARAYNFQRHVFNYEASKTIRYYREENLLDGVIDLRVNDLLVAITVRWSDKDYGDFFEETCSLILDMNFNFTIPYTIVGKENKSQLSKALVLEQGCST